MFPLHCLEIFFHVSFRHPIAREDGKVFVLQFFGLGIPYLHSVIRGPAVIELVDHLGFIERQETEPVVFAFYILRWIEDIATEFPSCVL